MSRKLMVILGVLVLVSLTTTIVFAGSMRFREVTVTTTEETGGGKGGGKNNLSDIPLIEASGPGSVTVNSFTPLFAHATLVGLGNLPVEAKFSAVLEAQNVTCTNHGGESVEAQPRKFEVTIEQEIPPENFEKNGTVSFTLELDQPEFSSGDVCPNSNWSAELDLLWNGLATVEATQPDGQLVTEKFECNQSVPGADLVCQSAN